MSSQKRIMTGLYKKTALGSGHCSDARFDLTTLKLDSQLAETKLQDHAAKESVSKFRKK
jgi:hypothetical protein